MLVGIRIASELNVIVEIFEGSLIFASLFMTCFFLLRRPRNVCILELQLFVQGYVCRIEQSVSACPGKQYALSVCKYSSSLSLATLPCILANTFPDSMD